MLAMTKKAIARLARRLGYEILPTSAVPTMDGALARIARRCAIRTVIDVGASDGRWSVAATRHFPGASYLLIEAQEHAHGAALRRLQGTDARMHPVLAAAGDRSGEAYFHATEPFGGHAARAEEPGAVVVPMTTVDAEVERLGLTPPFLLKLDTHGFELPILAGARRTLEQTDAIVVEAYNFTLREGALRFHEMCAHLDRLGFRSVDLADPMWRPADGILWQLDLVFCPARRSEFAVTSYA